MLRFCTILVTLFIVGSQMLIAQSVLKGRVVDVTTGDSLSDIIILAPNQGRQWATGRTGEFRIVLQSTDFPISLHFTKTGFAEHIIDFRTEPNDDILVALDRQIHEIEEVVVSTGYQRIGKERATGVYSHLDSSAVQYRTSMGILDRLVDNVPGLIFNNVGTKAINNNNILVRGQSTIESRTDPLIVIDDFPFDGDINTINPSDVESITVLRDAAATSIWGARAGNGVIVISTKRGEYEAKTTIKAGTGWQRSAKPDLHYRHAIDNDTFIELEKQLYEQGHFDARINSDTKSPLSSVIELLIKKDAYPDQSASIDARIEAMKNADLRADLERWAYRNASLKQYSMSLNGGSRFHQYYLSAGMDQSLESLRGNGIDRMTVRLDNAVKLFKDKIEINPTLNYSHSSQQYFFLPYQLASMYPYADLIKTDGGNTSLYLDVSERFNSEAQNTGAYDWGYRLMEELDLADNTQNMHTLHIGIRGKYDLNRQWSLSLNYRQTRIYGDGIHLQSIGSYATRYLINQYSAINANGRLQSAIPTGAIRDFHHQQSGGYSLRPQLNFVGIDKLDGLSAIVGYELSESRTQSEWGRDYGYNSDYGIMSPVDYNSFYQQYPNANLYRQVPFVSRETETVDRFVSMYANAGYLWKNRYMLTSSVRWDRSNLFGVKTNQKGVPLYSAGLSWNITNEDFMTNTNLDLFKVRLTYGKSGNVNRTSSAFTTAQYGTYLQANGLPFATIVNPPNPQLRWEQTTMFNIGIDFGVLDNFISGSMDFYRKKGTDIIGMSPLPPQTGVSSFRGNSANTRGVGLDVHLQTVQKTGTFTWNTDWLYHYEDEKVTQYLSNQPSASAFVNGPGIPAVGFPLYSIYSYKWEGLDPNNGDPRGSVDSQVSKDYATIFAGTSLDELVFHGSARPTHFGSVRNNYHYRGWSFSFTVNFRAGFYFRRESIDHNGILDGEGGHSDYYLRWQKQGDEKTTFVPSVPTLTNTNRDLFYKYSEVLVEKGDFIRLQDAKLSYRFGNTDVSRWLKSANIYLFVDHLGMLWTKNKLAIDPDVVPQVNSLRTKAPTSIALGIQFTL